MDKPVRTTPLAPWPFFAKDEVDSVVSVLTSGKVNYWTGSFVKQFENDFAQFHGMKHGLALANGTLTLELALWGLGIGPGDEVISTCRTFIASSSCIARVGATPILTDIDRDSQNMTAETIAPHITGKTKAIIVVHLAGWPCDMEAIMNLANKHGLSVIEDCAQAHGARIKGRLVGSFGLMSSFSFCQDKIMTTGGEGGVLLLNDTEMYEKLWAFKDHGKSYESVYRKSHPPGFRWLHESFGTNYRMTEMQGVIGLRQLEKLPLWIEQRNNLAHAIIEGVKGTRGLRIPVPASNITHAYYKLYFFVKPEELSSGWTRDKVIEAINAEGIPCMVGSCSEIYLEKAFTKANLGPKNRYQTAVELGDTSVMFMVHPTLDLEYAKDVVAAIKKVMAKATTSS
jgi:dTDP-4-amino-4,6-dideoxygalactose transaminase